MALPQSLLCHPLIVSGPNPLNVGQTLRDTTAQEKKQALAGSLHPLGKSNVPLSEKGESTLASLRAPLGGCGSRYEDIHGPKWFCECGEVEARETKAVFLQRVINASVISSLRPSHLALIFSFSYLQFFYLSWSVQFCSI